MDSVVSFPTAHRFARGPLAKQKVLASKHLQHLQTNVDPNMFLDVSEPRWPQGPWFSGGKILILVPTP